MVKAVQRTATNLRDAWESGRFPFRPQEAVLAGIVTAVVQFATAFQYGIAKESDFAIFLRTAERFVDGRRMYSPSDVDFTPPHFHVVLLPLAHVDPGIAFVLWTTVNAVLAWMVLRLVLRGVPGAWERRWLIAGCVANAAGVQMTIRLGQVSWLVASLVTLAWLSARSSRPLASGLYAGLAIAFKPFLLVLVPVFIVRKQWRTLAGCVFTILMSLGLGVAVFGIEPLNDWVANLRLTPDPSYVTHFLNASWAGVVMRGHLPYAMVSMLAAATILVMLWHARSSDEDKAWLLAGIAALLASPVGWIYYQPVLLGPAVAVALSGRLTHVRWIVLASVIPGLSRTAFQQSGVVVALTLGSIYFWSFFAVFTQLVRPAAAPAQVNEAVADSLRSRGSASRASFRPS